MTLDDFVDAINDTLARGGFNVVTTTRYSNLQAGTHAALIEVGVWTNSHEEFDRFHINIVRG